MKQTPLSPEITATSSKEKLMATKRSKDIFCNWKSYFGVIRRKSAFELLMVEANPGNHSPQLTLMLRLSRDAVDLFEITRSHFTIA